MLTETYIEKMRGGLISTGLAGKKYMIVENFTGLPKTFTSLENSLGLIFDDSNPNYIFLQLLDINSFLELLEGDINYDGTTYYTDGIATGVFSGKLAERLVNLTKDNKNAIIFCNTIPMLLVDSDSDKLALSQINNYIRKLTKAFGVKTIEVDKNLNENLEDKTIKSLLYQ